PPLESTLSSAADEPICHHCEGLIRDQFFLRACGLHLESAGKCYCKEGRMYCREDYCRLFSESQSCPRCRLRLHPNDLVMRAGSRRYHLACFTCGTCQRPFAPGDTFGMDAGGQVLCPLHLRPGGAGVTEAKKMGKLATAACLPAQQRPKGRPKKSPKAVVPADSATSTTAATVAAEVAEGHPGAQQQFNPLTSSVATTVSVDADFHSLGQGVGDGGKELIGCLGLPPVSESSSDHIALPTSSSSELGGQPPEQPHQRSEVTYRHQQHPQRQKRVRTSFKHHQLRAMKAYFLVNHNPDSKDLKQLAQRTSLSKRVLQVWFQNARAKYRRSLLKQSQAQLDLSPGNQEPLQLMQQMDEEPSGSDISSGNVGLMPAQAGTGKAGAASDDDADVDSMQGFITLHSVNCH
uniref:Homeobox domain-containing protein n=1 Tax=Macrostomum lignano TaxID=282301 RepID=A0A1I8FZ34_9PLAT